MQTHRWLAAAVTLLLATWWPSAAAQAGAYPEPDFRRLLFDLDSVFLEAGELKATTDALAALASNFPDDPKVTPDLRARALAISLRLNGLHPPSLSAHTRLKAGETPEEVEGFVAPALIGEALWSMGETLDTTDASQDDLLLACYLMDIAARIDPDRPGGLARFQQLRVRGDYKGWRGVLPGVRGFEFPRDPPPDPPVDLPPVVPPVDPPPAPAELQVESGIGSMLVLDVARKPPGGRVGGLRANAIVGGLDSPMTLRFQDAEGVALPGFAGVAQAIPAAVAAGGIGWPNNGGSITIAIEGGYDRANGEGLALASALLARSLITGKEFEPGVVAVGAIDADGALAAVPRMLPRLRDVSALEAPMIVIPAANLPALNDLAIVGELEPLLRHQIFAVPTLSAAAVVALEQTDAIKRARLSFGEVQHLGRSMPAASLAGNSKVQDRLEEIIEAVPSHASARLLLAAGRGTLRDPLSPEGSIYALERAAAPVIEIMRAGGDPFASGATLNLDQSKSALAAVRAKLDRRTVVVADELRDLIEQMEEYAELNNKTSTRGEAMFAELKTSWTALRKSYGELRGERSDDSASRRSSESERGALANE